jgi:GTP-binding protein
MDAAFRMLCTTLDFSEYVGRIAIGRVYSGTVKKGQRVSLMQIDDHRQNDTVDRLMTFDKLGRVDAESVSAGDICALVGLEEVSIGDTICEVENTEALPRIAVDEPTLSMVFGVNDSPLVGEGTYLTSRHIYDRLLRELRSNVALKVEPSEDGEAYKVSGRGLLHLSVLIETMRREGYELSVGKPEVILKRINGELNEPYEELVVDVPGDGAGGPAAW